MQKIGLLRFQSVMSSTNPDLKKEEQAFLKSIDPKKDFLFTGPGKGYPTLFFIQTGGSEIFFKEIYENFEEPYLLLVQGCRNSLAAALEILSFLHRQGKEGYILQGEPAEINKKLHLLSRLYNVNQKLRASRLGVIGKPSDWLISSDVEKKKLREKWGVELVSVPNKEFLDSVDKMLPYREGAYKEYGAKTSRKGDLKQSLYVYGALKEICKKRKLDGFTLRCFDLVNEKKQTSCLAFGMLNDEGIVSTCEGDVPSLLTMYLCQLLLEQPSFMANPARIDTKKKEVVYAHCTCPFKMTTSYRLDTHFESGLGFGIKGELKRECITAVKLSPDLDKVRILSGRIVDNLDEKNLCRTQIRVAFDDSIEELIKDPYGNHMIFVYGDHEEELKALFEYIGL